MRADRLRARGLALVLCFALVQASPAGDESLYARLGGARVVGAVVDETIDRVSTDARLKRSFEGSNLPRIKRLLAEQICELTGGGCRYSGDSMREVHAGHHIREAEFYGLVEILGDALRHQRVAARERNELLALLAPMKRDVVEAAAAPGSAASVRAAAVPAASALQVSVTDPAGHPIGDAVVYAVPEKPEVALAGSRAVIDQVNRRFVPRVSAIQTGTAVVFPNSDNIRHSVYSFSPAKPFTLKIYSGTPASPVVFDKPGVVVLGCNIHDTMVAWILVADTPYLARTDAAGATVIASLPPGHYRLRAWAPPMQQEAAGEALEVGAGALAPRVLRIAPGTDDTLEAPAR